MDKADRKMKFHVIHSAKGGCGKTTFSLMKSIDIAIKQKHKIRKRGDAKVLYLDCDFRGSAVKALLYGLGLEKESKAVMIRPMETGNVIWRNGDMGANAVKYISLEEDYDAGTLNDFIRSEEVYLEDILVHGYTYMDIQQLKINENIRAIIEENGIGENRYIINGKIDFIFSSSDGRDKDCFKHSMHSANSTMIDIGVFKLRIRYLLRQIASYGRLYEAVSPKYTDVVIDMPPGTDEYANALLEEIREFADQNRRKISVLYYNMTTLDRGHIYATVEHIADLLGGSKRISANHPVFCVMTEQVKEEYGSNLEVAKEKKEMVYHHLKRQGLDCRSLQWLVNRYSKEYYLSSRSSDAIQFTYEIEEM